MKIREETVVEVVQEASTKMADANYSAVMVGGFVQTQAAAAQYISAFATELGGPEGVVNTIFHASLIAVCFQRAYGRTVFTVLASAALLCFALAWLLPAEGLSGLLEQLGFRAGRG